MPILQRLQARAPIEAEQPGQGHREVRVAVGIDGELRDLECLVADDAFDGGTGLALLVEHERLGVDDAAAIAHVQVDADRGRLAAGIERLSRPRNVRLWSIQTVSLRSARRTLSRVATSNAQNAHS